MVRSEEEREERLAQLEREVPTRGVERLPWTLKEVGDLPAELQSPTVASLAPGAAIERIIAFPPQIHRGWHYVPKQALLFTPTDVIHVQASIWPDEEPQMTVVRGSSLLLMKATLLLLYGFLEIVAQGDGSPTRIGVEFNTVAWDMLSRPLRQLLQATTAAPGAPAGEPGGTLPYAPAAREAVEALPLKFSNGVKIHGLLPGEELEEVVFQPGTWKRRLLLFRRQVSANTLLLLTSNYVVVIQEELEVSQGWIVSYLPRGSISAMESQPRGLWNELTVQLQRGDQTVEQKLMLKEEAVQAWRAVWIQHGGRWEEASDGSARAGAWA